MTAIKLTETANIDEIKRCLFPHRIRIPRFPHKGVLTFNQLETVRTNNRTTKMYKLIESYDADGDVSKEWFVKYHFLIPDQLRKPGQSNWQRFKVTTGINTTTSKGERRKKLSIVKKGMTLLLKSGFNPFVEFNLCNEVTYSGHTISNCITQYLDEIKSDVKPNTLRKYKTHLDLFDTWLAENGHSLKMIYHADKSLVYSFLKENQLLKEWSNKTYNHYLNSLHALFQHFINNHDGYVDKNPCI